MQRISIITVTYNSENTIADTIQSVLSQDYPNVEYILIDGNSKDKTLQIINGFRSQLSKVISEPDKGNYDAINKGIRLATGDVIGILNSDDFYADNKVLSSVMNVFQKHNCDCTYGDLEFVNRFDTNKVVRKWVAGEYKAGRFLSGWMPPHPTFFVRKTVYDAHGLFSISLKFAADYELMLRFIHKHACSIKYIPRVLVKMRAGGFGNASMGAKIKANIEDRKAWRMNGLRPGLFTLWNKPFSKILQFVSK